MDRKSYSYKGFQIIAALFKGTYQAKASRPGFSKMHVPQAKDLLSACEQIEQMIDNFVLVPGHLEELQNEIIEKHKIFIYELKDKPYVGTYFKKGIEPPLTKERLKYFHGRSFNFGFDVFCKRCDQEISVNGECACRKLDVSEDELGIILGGENISFKGRLKKDGRWRVNRSILLWVFHPKLNENGHIKELSIEQEPIERVVHRFIYTAENKLRVMVTYMDRYHEVFTLNEFNDLISKVDAKKLTVSTNFYGGSQTIHDLAPGPFIINGLYRVDGKYF